MWKGGAAQLLFRKTNRTEPTKGVPSSSYVHLRVLAALSIKKTFPLFIRQTIPKRHYLPEGPLARKTPGNKKEQPRFRSVILLAGNSGNE
ncbi:hypothetical protein [uncultured Akkermansia sp.]|uniref:hypothetical protein n=1 Tax=uncultured Akkermansia sp. TaxID=512294 RepID=UPI00260C8D71|nr:hypothetical protein [uncultured Akkermansia sp.]